MYRLPLYIPDAVIVGARFRAHTTCQNEAHSRHLRGREITACERLMPDDGEGDDATTPIYGVPDGQSVLLQFAKNGSIRQYHE